MDGTEHRRSDELVAADDRVIGVAFRWSLLVVILLAAIGAVFYVLTREPEAAPVVIERGPIEPPPVFGQDASRMPAVVFRDVTTGSGINFVHSSGAAGDKLLPETMGGGCAFLDYDGDEDQDLLLVNGRHWSGAAPVGAAPTMALYRNNGAGYFEDVTGQAGLDETMYGMGVAVGDYDNDGDADVFISALGANRLFRNERGRFEDVTGGAHVAGADDAWSSSAGFFDYDNDGYLDLFVCNYVLWSRAIDLELNFTLNGTDRAYGPPKLYKGTQSYLYRNNGDGTFIDVTKQAGIAVDNPATGEPMGKALAVTFADIDHDGFIDILVANDTVQNFLFRNVDGSRFEDIGALAGVAFDAMGSATGAMGMDVADFGNDRTLGVAIANFANESTSLYAQQGGRSWQFADIASIEGIGSPSRIKLSFGLFFFDYDLDGRLDMFQANGHLEEEINAVQPSQHYEQSPQLFWNGGPEARPCFATVAMDASGDLSAPVVGRGAAYADIDGDGDLDVLMTQTGRRPVLLRNEQSLGRHWLRVKLRGTAANRDAIGAWVELTAGGITQRRQVMPTRSYLSQVELPVTFGLGDAARVDTLSVIWPNGTQRSVPVDGVDRMIFVEQE